MSEATPAESAADASAKVKWTVGELARRLDGELRGPADLVIDSLAEASLAVAGQLTFINDERYVSQWTDGAASAALIKRGIEVEPGDKRAVVLVDDADLGMAEMLELFAPPLAKSPVGVHGSARVSGSAHLGQNVGIGPGAVVGPNVHLGDGCVLHAGAVVMDDCVLGPGCVLWPNVVVRERCRLGARCILHPGAVIGADGFGYRPEKGPDGLCLRKVPQIGTVVLGDDVEVGANSAVDRAKFAETVVGDGCKLDNLVQIGHNCRIGKHVVIAGCCGIGGSCVIGDYAQIGGMVMMRDHMVIGARSRVAGGAAVIENVPEGESWGGYPAGPIKQKLKEELAVRRLPELLKLAKAWLPDSPKR